MRFGKIIRDQELAAHVVDRLAQCWSPEPIAGHLRRDQNLAFRVCHETIYKFAYGPALRLMTLHFEPANPVSYLYLSLLGHIPNNGFGMWYATLG